MDAQQRPIGVAQREDEMTARPCDPVSAYLLRAPRSLREACRAAGLDQGGARCPDCPLRDLCENDARWLVRPPPSHIADR